MVRRRSVALPSLFPAATITSSRPHGPTIIEPRVATAGSLRQSLPQSVGMTVVFLLRYKKGNPSAVCYCQVSPIFELDIAAALVFPLRLVFGQPATSPSPLLLHPLIEQAVLLSSLTTSRRSSKKTERRTPAPSSTMAQFVDMFESLYWMLAAMYLCIVGGVCLLLVFHVHIHCPLPHELR
jgi:hypothetical protein